MDFFQFSGGDNDNENNNNTAGGNNIISIWGGNGGNADEFFNIQYGDIVILHSNTNETLNGRVFFIEYVDETEFRCVDTDDLENRFIFKMKTDTNTGKSVLVDGAALSSVEIISRSVVLGYARNNGLVVKEDQPVVIMIEWNPLFQKPITQAKIVGLDQDCIELQTVETVPERLFIDFEYKGLPDYISKLRILPAVLEGETPEEVLNEEAGNWEETEANADEMDERQVMFQEGNDITRTIVGEDDVLLQDEIVMEEMGEIDVQITKSNARFTLNIQKQDLQDTLYLQYPKHLQTPDVDRAIEVAVQRFVELRQTFSSFENTPITVRKMEKQPIISLLLGENGGSNGGDWGKNWFVPVVHLRKSLFYTTNKNDRGLIEDMDDSVVNQYNHALYFQELGALEQEREKKWGQYTAGELNGGDGNSFDFLMNSLLQKPWKSLDNATGEQLIPWKFKNNREVFLNNQLNPSYLSSVPTIEAHYPLLNNGKLFDIKTNHHQSRDNDKNDNAAFSFMSPQSLLKNEVTHIRSFVVLPEALQDYSQLWLYSTSLKRQTELSAEPLQMFQWIQQPPVAYPIHLNDATHELYSTFTTKTTNKKQPPEFAFDMTHYYLEDDVKTKNNQTNNLTTTQTNPAVLLHGCLKQILPQTPYYLEWKRQHGKLQGIYSFVGVVKQLNTLAIYPENVEATVCEKIVGKDGIVENNIRHFKNQWRKRSGELKGQWDILKNIYKTPVSFNDLHLLFSTTDPSYATTFAEAYRVSLKNTASGLENPRVLWTNSEIVNEAIQTDQSKLFNLLFIQQVLQWLNPQHFLSGNVPIEVDLDVDVAKTRKINYRKKHLHKKYGVEDDLRRDNTKDDVFVDDELLDPITRELIEKYSASAAAAAADASTKEPDEVLQEKILATLVDKEASALHKLGIDTAVENHYNEPLHSLIQTILQGKCRVVDGDYAMLVETKKRITVNRMGKKIQEVVPFRNRFYRRVKNIWVYDSDLTSELFQNIQELTQQYNKLCKSSGSGGVVDGVDAAKTKILYEFERRYSQISAEITEQITDEINQQVQFIHHKRRLESQWSLFQNSQMQEYAEIYNARETAEPVVISQFSTLRNLILEQHDEAKKYYDVVVFYDQYCRQAIVPEEDPYWAYCRQTNTPLLPIALLQLAKAFNTGITQTFVNKLNEVCANPEFTTISDDGGFYVLKQGGYNIRAINDATEENVSYRLLGGGEAAQESEEITNQFIDQLFDNMSSGTGADDISTRVVNVVYQYLNRQYGIAANRRVFDAMQIIFNDVKRNRKVVKDEAGYNDYILKKNAKESGNGVVGISDPPYAEHLQKVYVVLCAAAYFAIVQSIYPAVQISKTNRQSPTDCVFSLQGFPLHTDDEKNEGLHYLSCILFNNKTDTVPWKALKHQNKDALFKLLKGVMNFVIQVPLLLNALILKRTKLSSTTTQNQSAVIDTESVQAWFHFLPPIVPFSVVKDINSTPETVQVLLNETIQQMKRGGVKQREMLLKVQSVNLLLTYGLVERINRLVKAEQLLFASKSSVLYLENACCDDSNIKNPSSRSINVRVKIPTSIQYFTDRDPTILEYLQQSQILNQTMDAFASLKIAPFLFYTTPPLYPTQWITTTTEIKTVLRVYIHYLYDLKMWRDPTIQKTFPFLSRREPLPLDYSREWSFEKKKEVLLGSSGNNHNVVEYMEKLPLFMKLIHSRNRVVPFVSLKAGELRQRQCESFAIVLETLLEQNPQNIIYSQLHQYLRENQRNHHKSSAVIQEENARNSSEENSEENDKLTIDDLKNTLYSSKNRLQDYLVDYLKKGQDRSNTTDHIPFLFLEKGRTENEKTKTLDENTYLQFIQNSLYYFLQYLPNRIARLDKVPERSCDRLKWGFSETHEEILQGFWAKEEEWFASFHGNAEVQQFLLQYKENTADYVRLIQSIPQHLFGGALFDLYSYFFVNAVFMYMELCVKLEAETNINTSSSSRTNTTTRENTAGGLLGVVGGVGVGGGTVSRMNAIYLESMDAEPADIVKQVALLVRLGLNFVENNQMQLYKSYEAILVDTRLNALEEKKMIMNRMETLSKKERAVEKLMKMYKLGSWNVGKEVFVYNKAVYDADVILLKQPAVNGEGVGVDVGDDGEGVDGDDDDFFENQANEAAGNFRNSNNVHPMGDGDYERDGEDDEVYDDGDAAEMEDGGYDDDNDGNYYAGDDGAED